jgi:GNAT superfamily N-acetyltransferase
VLIETRSALDPELATLVTAQQRELRELGGGPARAAFTPDDDSAYLVAAIDGRAVACAAWRPLGTGVAELGRMYVRPAFRGRGIARQLIVAVEEEALAAGRPVIRLDTTRPLEAAIGLYLSSGYRPIPAYGEYAGNPDRLCFEKTLAALVQ